MSRLQLLYFYTISICCCLCVWLKKFIPTNGIIWRNCSCFLTHKAYQSSSVYSVFLKLVFLLSVSTNTYCRELNRKILFAMKSKRNMKKWLGYLYWNRTLLLNGKINELKLQLCQATTTSNTSKAKMVD